MKGWTGAAIATRVDNKDGEVERSEDRVVSVGVKEGNRVDTMEDDME